MPIEQRAPLQRACNYFETISHVRILEICGTKALGKRADLLKKAAIDLETAPIQVAPDRQKPSDELNGRPALLPLRPPSLERTTPFDRWAGTEESTPPTLFSAKDLKSVFYPADPPDGKGYSKGGVLVVFPEAGSNWRLLAAPSWVITLLLFLFSPFNS